MLFRPLHLIIGLLFFCAPAYAADKVQVNAEPSWLYKINADLGKRPASKHITGGYYYILFDRQVNLANQTEYAHYIRQIENEAGVQNASEVSVTYSPEFQQLVFHKINLWRNGVIVSSLKPSEIKVVQEETDASDFQYNGMKRAFVILKDVRKGDRVEYAYSLVGFNPVFENKYSDNIYFGYDMPICNYFETLISPVQRNLFIHSFNKAPAPVEEERNGNRIYRWNHPVMEPWDYPSGVPSWFDNSPFVSITEYKTWQDVINWGVKLFRNYQYELPEGLKQKIKQWKRQANGDQDAFTSLALEFVQNDVRYLGLEIGTHTHEPHAPAEVYHQLFGDCKDKALLLARILQYENIPAYVALVNTTKKSKIIDAPPSPYIFNHAIVAIERSDYVFVDPTISLQKGELVNRFVPAYGYALILRDNESTLKPVEPGFLYNSAVEETLYVSYQDTSRLTVTSTYAGGSADDFRALQAESGTAELEKNFLSFYDKLFKKIDQAEPLKIKEDSFKNEIMVTESYVIPSLTDTDEKGREKFEVFAKQIYQLFPDPSDADNNVPLALSFPMSIQYKLVLVMPEQTSLSLEEIHLRNDAFEFDFQPQTRGNHVILEYTLKMLKDHIAASDIEKYKNDYKRIVDVLDVEFTDSTGLGLTGADTSYGINWSMVYIIVMVTGLLAFVLKKLNQLHVEVPYEYGTGWPIGGWLVLLGVSLGVGCIYQIFTFASNNYFSASTWTALGENSGKLLQVTWFAEIIFSLLWLCGSIALLYWFFQRRNIFPKMFLWFVGSMLVGRLLLFAFYNFTPNRDPQINASLGENLARALFYGLIWGGYVWRADRVKFTFTEPAA